MIKVVHGKDHLGWAGIDDFEFHHDEDANACPTMPDEANPPTPPTTTTPKPIATKCDFQDDLCGWKHRDYEFTFNRTNGQALTDNEVEGPGYDHTQSKESTLVLPTVVQSWAG